MCLYLRDLSLAEGKKPQNIIRSSRNRIKVRRAQVVLASNQGSKVPQIAARFYFSPGDVRTISQQFHQRGWEALETKSRPGPPD